VKQSDCLLVIISGETLRRPWCVGEIVTAHQSNIRMFTLDIKGGAETNVSELLAKFTPEQRDFGTYFFELRPFGIMPDMIKPALEFLLNQTMLTLNMKTTKGLIWFVKEIVKTSTTGRKSSRPTIGSIISFRSKNKELADQANSGAILVMSDFGNIECTASAHLLRWMLQEKLQDEVAVDLDIPDEDFTAAVSAEKLRTVMCCIMTSSKTSAQQLARLAVLYAARPAVKAIAVIVADKFDFPDQAFYKDLEGGTASFSTQLADELPVGMSGKDVAAALRTLFSGIAVFVNVAFASGTILNASVKNVAARVKDVWMTPTALQMVGGTFVTLQTSRKHAAQTTSAAGAAVATPKIHAEGSERSIVST
jgi:hypothetical protein